MFATTELLMARERWAELAREAGFGRGGRRPASRFVGGAGTSAAGTRAPPKIRRLGDTGVPAWA